MVLGTVPARHWFCGALIREKHGQVETLAAGEYEKGGLFLRSSEPALMVHFSGAAAMKWG
jgi:hypothetical protein